MILRPVRPASPIGPPVTNRPVGLTCMTGSSARSVARDRRQDDRLDDVARGAARVATSGSCWAETTTVRTRFGTPCSYSTVTCVLPSGRRYGSWPRLADLGQAARHPVRERDRQRHQLRRLVAGEPEHHPLVAGAELAAAAPSARTSSAASTPCAMSGDCSLTRHERAAGLVVEAVVGRACSRCRGPCRGRPSGSRRRSDVRDLAEHQHEAGRRGRLAGDAGVRVLAR